MEITDVKNPRKNAQRSVDLDISTDGVTFIPFTAMPGDTAGNDLFEKPAAVSSVPSLSRRAITGNGRAAAGLNTARRWCAAWQKPPKRR